MYNSICLAMIPVQYKHWVAIYGRSLWRVHTDTYPGLLLYGNDSQHVRGYRVQVLREKIIESFYEFVI